MSIHVLFPLALLSTAGCVRGQPFEPNDGVATDISIVAYSDGWGNELGASVLDTEGEVVCDWPEDQPYGDVSTYYFYASATGFYTELYTCSFGETTNVDLDAVGEQEDAIAGAVFATQSFFAPIQVANTRIGLAPGGETQTDVLGRFGVGDLPLGDVGLSLRWESETMEQVVPNGAGLDYLDWKFAAPMQAAKPNIYLWPVESTVVSVKLDYPRGGHLDVSDPPYGDGWSVTATPDGWLDGTYGFLFYEATVPPALQLTEGWVVAGDDVESGLRGLLADAGFVGREIDDFVDWWLPRLEPAAYYAVYPQNADDWVTLEVDPQPDAVLRALWLIHPMPVSISLVEPEVVPLDRSGFTLTEWGVILP